MSRLDNLSYSGLIKTFIIKYCFMKSFRSFFLFKIDHMRCRNAGELLRKLREREKLHMASNLFFVLFKHFRMEKINIFILHSLNFHPYSLVFSLQTFYESSVLCYSHLISVSVRLSSSKVVKIRID